MLLVTVNLRYDTYCIALLYFVWMCNWIFVWKWFESAFAMNWWPRPRTVQWCVRGILIFNYSSSHVFRIAWCVCARERGTLCLAVDSSRARSHAIFHVHGMELILENEIHIKHCCWVWFQLTRLDSTQLVNSNFFSREVHSYLNTTFRTKDVDIRIEYWIRGADSFIYKLTFVIHTITKGKSVEKKNQESWNWNPLTFLITSVSNGKMSRC